MNGRGPRASLHEAGLPKVAGNAGTSRDRLPKWQFAPCSLPSSLLHCPAGVLSGYPESLPGFSVIEARRASEDSTFRALSRTFLACTSGFYGDLRPKTFRTASEWTVGKISRPERAKVRLFPREKRPEKNLELLQSVHRRVLVVRTRG